jgi:hypothetical protein
LRWVDGLFFMLSVAELCKSFNFRVKTMVLAWC